MPGTALIPKGLAMNKIAKISEILHLTELELSSIKQLHSFDQIMVKTACKGLRKVPSI
jgi:hypothetical protein